MWGVYPEAKDWNVAALCSDFKLAEPFLVKKAPRAIKLANLGKRTKLGAQGLFGSQLIHNIYTKWQQEILVGF